MATLGVGVMERDNGYLGCGSNGEGRKELCGW